jgi:hypothetical protein
MPGKPRSQWSEPYRKRVERKEAALRAAKGGKRLTAAEEKAARQAGRGHKAKEHITRHEANKAKVDMLGGLTAKDRAYVRTQARKIQAETSGGEKGHDRAETERRMLEFASKHGADRFRELMKLQQGRRREYVRRQKEGAWIPYGGEFWAAVQADYGIDDEDMYWLWYMGAVV